jgi:hypothetical protein
METFLCIRVGGRRDALDLVETLARRGLVAWARPGEQGWEVELRAEREPTARLLADVALAVRGWLEDVGRESLPLRVGDQSHLLTRRQGIVRDEHDPLGGAIVNAR